MTENGEEIVARIADARDRITKELRKAIIGQDQVIEEIIIALLSRGHCLMTGVPGLGKTKLVKSIANIFSLSFKRIQFTPDLMPTDIYGTEVLDEDPVTGKHLFTFVKGPVFANMVLADEINRTPPKTQAALLEAMEEQQVTAGGTSMQLDKPFFVLATQNPIELEGTYPLPEAQLDRFLFNIVLEYLTPEQEEEMVLRTTDPSEPELHEIFSADEIIEIQQLVRQVPAPSNVIKYAVRLVGSTRTVDSSPQYVRDMIKWGAGSRASQALVLAGKARALLNGRYNVAIEDIQALALPVLRHRMITNFHADADNVTTEDIIRRLLNDLPTD
ncbi:AAA family ATPase [bacterium M21]|nr:AAA family ATPase [bacterium M21]